MEVFEFRLIGMEALWEILLQARDLSVHTRALEFLQRLHKRMNTAFFQEKLGLIKMNLLEICDRNIRLGQQELLMSESQREQQRGIEAT